MAKMLNVYDRATRKKTAVLQNAFDIDETQELNQIYSLSFTLPYEDVKNKYCLPRHYVRYGDDGQLYRIKSPKVNDSSVGTITYECEHVITTLCDDIMFGSFTYGGKGVPTKTTINWLLSQQKTKNWKLGTCAFTRYFEYNWEQENLLNALYSIPREFVDAYMWDFDTISYPWTINLKLIDKSAAPEYYLRARSNILASGTSADYANICTRIYPLGYGEGVNQLTIKEATITNAVKATIDGKEVNVNATVSETSTTKYGNTFIQSPQSYIDKYGIVEKVLVDRRFEQANTLFGYAKSMLDVYQEPTMSRSFDVTDLHQITNRALDDAQVGKICKMTQDNTIAYITKTQRRLDVAGDLQIDLSTKATDIASNVADLADRIRIESVYAQGATQIYQHSKDANAVPVFDKDGAIKNGKGMMLNLYFPREMKQINKVLLRMKLKKFRCYSTNQSAFGGGVDGKTEDGGAIAKDAFKKTESGGAITADDKQKTGGGGGINTKTTADGGQSGTTGISNGGGGISLTPSINVKVIDTGDANWKNESTIPTSRTFIDDYEAYGTTIRTESSGGHQHSVTGTTSSVTLDQEDIDEENSHAHNLYSDYVNTTSNGSHTHVISDDTGHTHAIGKSNLKHNHPVDADVSIQVINKVSSGSFSHSHSFYIGDHQHSITIPSHQHQIILAGHKHDIKIKSHTHEINPGIFESGDPTAFYVYVKGKKLVSLTVESDGKTYSCDKNGLWNYTSFDGDITTWLLNDKNLIQRDTWIDVEIVPNDNAYVVSSVFVQGFVQSRGGGNY